MTIFPNQRLVFLHIPKTAGRSIKKFLQDKEGGPVNLGIPHLFPREYVSEGHITQSDWDAFEKFTVIRNPWARAVSAYKYHLRTRKREPFADFLGEYIKGGWDLRRHGEPQSRYIHGLDGRIYRYEFLAEDFPGLPRVNSSQDATNYRDFYTPATRALIADTYAEDIERFDYHFENGDPVNATA